VHHRPNEEWYPDRANGAGDYRVSKRTLRPYLARADAADCEGPNQRKRILTSSILHPCERGDDEEYRREDGDAVQNIVSSANQYSQ
jgi:hypothetical protein